MMEKGFHVVWEMDIFAETPTEAARHAWKHMRSHDSTANVFDVFDKDGEKTTVDLMEDEHA